MCKMEYEYMEKKSRLVNAIEEMNLTLAKVHHQIALMHGTPYLLSLLTCRAKFDDEEEGVYFFEKFETKVSITEENLQDIIQWETNLSYALDSSEEKLSDEQARELKEAVRNFINAYAKYAELGD